MTSRVIRPAQKRRKKVVHRGNHYDRTKIKDELGRREKIFAHAWEEENKLLQRFTFGGVCSKLDELMVQNDRIVPVSQETATAVATVVQWLAAPVGFAFLEQTLLKAGYRVSRIKNES